MTENMLRNYIRCFNSNRWKYPASFFDLTADVTVGKIFPDYFKGQIVERKTERYFFIKSNNRCVGIIFDMNTDLHWLILKKYRGQGYLYNALQNAILPFLKSEGRSDQRCTAATQEGREYLLKLGFEQQGNEYFLSLKKIKKFDSSQIERSPLTPIQLEDIRSKLHRITDDLRIISNQLECSYGKTYGLNNLAETTLNKALDIGLDCRNIE